MNTIDQDMIANEEISYWVDQAQALERLEKNSDFQKVILEGYFKDKAVSGVSILAVDQGKASGRRTDVMEALIAISTLQDHFKVIKAMGAPSDDGELDDGDE